MPRESAPADAGDVPADLLQLLDGWNELGTTIVRSGNGAQRDPPAKATLNGWKRAQRDPELRDALADVPALLAAIRKAKFCHGQGWFRLPWLFKRKTDDDPNAVKLMNGAYDNATRTNGRAEIGAGQQFDPSAKGGW